MFKITNGQQPASHDQQTAAKQDAALGRSSGISKLSRMNSELKAIVEAQDAKLAVYNAKRRSETAELEAKAERLEALAVEAEQVAEQMMQLRQQVRRIEAEKELLLAA